MYGGRPKRNTRVWAGGESRCAVPGFLLVFDNLHWFCDHSVMGPEDPNQLAGVEFEVYGQVQGCFFTKYCKELAEQLGLGGWVKNSKKGTIVGKIQGYKAELDHMIDWLTNAGSPGCKIEKCELTNWEYTTKRGYTDFSIRF